jgi:acyl carrier protein
MKTENTLKQILSKLGFEATNKQQRFKDDLGMDSLDMVETIMELEKELGIEIGVDLEDKMENMTISEFVEEIEKLREKK